MDDLTTTSANPNTSTQPGYDFTNSNFKLNPNANIFRFSGKDLSPASKKGYADSNIPTAKANIPTAKANEPSNSSPNHANVKANESQAAIKPEQSNNENKRPPRRNFNSRKLKKANVNNDEREKSHQRTKKCLKRERNRTKKLKQRLVMMRNEKQTLLAKLLSARQEDLIQIVVKELVAVY